MKQTRKVLLIEDNPADIRLMEILLQDAGPGLFTMQSCMLLQEAQVLLENETFDIMILDLSLPDGSGIQAVQDACQMAAGLPVIVVTGTDDENLAVEILKTGAQDYLVKGVIDTPLLVKTILYAIERQQLVSQLEYAKRRQEQLANHDILTGLPNRALFYDRLTLSLLLAKRQSQTIAVLFIDLDRFKSINDSLGHDAGDELLRVLARRFQSCIRASDTVARIGGDEFICILNNLTDAEDAAIVSKKLIECAAEKIELRQQTVFISISIGISIFPNDADDEKSLIRSADAAMYNAKKPGGEKYCFSETENSATWREATEA